MMIPRKYPAKLLLFGEYTVLNGGAALAMPYPKYSGYWRYLKDGESSPYLLQPFIHYLQNSIFPQGELDIAAFAKDVADGLIFDSTIPLGYGAGSSGSLCAGVWGRYGRGAEDIAALQANFVIMESFFHGQSSGLDPLVSYLNRPILQTSHGVSVLESFPIPKGIEVYDSGMSRSTAPLVEWYHQELTQNPTFKNQIFNFLLAQNAKAITAVVEQDSLALKKAFKAISQWQYENFKPLIPDSVQKAWSQAEKQSRYFKLCGAGGGGFFLIL